MTLIFDDFIDADATVRAESTEPLTDVLFLFFRQFFGTNNGFLSRGKRWINRDKVCLVN